jgi:hypothetical protein
VALNGHWFTVPGLVGCPFRATSTATATAVSGLGELLVRTISLTGLSVAAYGTGTGRFPVVIGGSGVGPTGVVISRLGDLGGVAVVSDGEFPFCERLVRAIGSAIGGGHGRSVVAGQVQDQVDNLGLSGP